MTLMAAKPTSAFLFVVSPSTDFPEVIPSNVVSFPKNKLRKAIEPTATISDRLPDGLLISGITQHKTTCFTSMYGQREKQPGCRIEEVCATSMAGPEGAVRESRRPITEGGICKAKVLFQVERMVERATREMYIYVCSIFCVLEDRSVRW